MTDATHAAGDLLSLRPRTCLLRRWHAAAALTVAVIALFGFTFSSIVAQETAFMSSQPMQNVSATAPNQVLTIKAHCAGKAPCVFENDNLEFEIVITNHQGFPVGIPLAYLQKSGPTIELVDDRTRASFQPRPGVPSPALLSNLTVIPPGGSVVLEWALFQGEIERFRHPESERLHQPGIAVTAHVTVEATLQIEGKSVEASSTCSFHITSHAPTQKSSSQPPVS